MRAHYIFRAEVVALCIYSLKNGSVSRSQRPVTRCLNVSKWPGNKLLCGGSVCLMDYPRPRGLQVVDTIQIFISKFLSTIELSELGVIPDSD
jgi:hypothetical protein